MTLGPICICLRVPCTALRREPWHRADPARPPWNLNVQIHAGDDKKSCHTAIAQAQSVKTLAGDESAARFDRTESRELALPYQDMLKSGASTVASGSAVQNGQVRDGSDAERGRLEERT